MAPAFAAISTRSDKPTYTSLERVIATDTPARCSAAWQYLAIFKLMSFSLRPLLQAPESLPPCPGSSATTSPGTDVARAEVALAAAIGTAAFLAITGALSSVSSIASSASSTFSRDPLSSSESALTSIAEDSGASTSKKWPFPCSSSLKVSSASASEKSSAVSSYSPAAIFLISNRAPLPSITEASIVFSPSQVVKCRVALFNTISSSDNAATIFCVSPSFNCASST